MIPNSQRQQSPCFKVFILILLHIFPLFFQSALEVDEIIDPPPPYLIHLRLMVMGAVHGVERVVLMVVMLVVMKAALWTQGLGIGSRGGGAVGERGRR